MFVEDKKLIRIVLPKADTGGHPCWKSLLIGQFEADAWTLEQMQKKITLERFQIEVSKTTCCNTCLRVLMCILLRDRPSITVSTSYCFRIQEWILQKLKLQETITTVAQDYTDFLI